jgi:catechol-2,3-dioxygenase
MSGEGIPTQLGHVALRVRDLERSILFYRDVMGLKLRAQHETVAFLGIREDASHEVALFQLSADAPGPEADRVGMYHMAWEMPSFDELERFHARLKANDVRITGYSPRQMNVMFLDPDGNELEAIYEPAQADLEKLQASPTGLPRLES